MSNVFACASLTPGVELKDYAALPPGWDVVVLDGRDIPRILDKDDLETYVSLGLFRRLHLRASLQTTSIWPRHLLGRRPALVGRVRRTYVSGGCVVSFSGGEDDLHLELRYQAPDEDTYASALYRSLVIQENSPDEVVEAAYSLMIEHGTSPNEGERLEDFIQRLGDHEMAGQTEAGTDQVVWRRNAPEWRESGPVPVLRVNDIVVFRRTIGVSEEEDGLLSVATAHSSERSLLGTTLQVVGNNTSGTSIVSPIGSNIPYYVHPHCLDIVGHCVSGQRLPVGTRVRPVRCHENDGRVGHGTILDALRSIETSARVRWDTSPDEPEHVSTSLLEEVADDASPASEGDFLEDDVVIVASCKGDITELRFVGHLGQVVEQVTRNIMRVRLRTGGMSGQVARVNMSDCLLVKRGGTQHRTILYSEILVTEYGQVINLGCTAAVPVLVDRLEYNIFRPESAQKVMDVARSFGHEFEGGTENDTLGLRIANVVESVPQALTLLQVSLTSTQGATVIFWHMWLWSILDSPQCFDYAKLATNFLPN